MEHVYQDTPRRYPSRTAIVDFWRENGCISHTNIRQCFKCNHVANGYHHQRAHIIPRMYGGTDDAKNIAILCGWCHKTQEFYLGEDSRTYEEVIADFYKWMGWVPRLLCIDSGQLLLDQALEQAVNEIAPEFE